MATYFTDFSEFSTGDIAADADWTSRQGTGWTSEITTDAGSTGGQTWVTDDNGYGIQHTVHTWDLPGLQTGDCEIACRVKFALVNPASTDPYPPTFYYDPTNNEGYAVRYTSSGNWNLVVLGTAGYVYSNIGSTGTGHFTPSDDTYFWFRFGISGTTVRFNVGSTVESIDPATWDFSATDTDVTQGYVAQLNAEDWAAMPMTVDVLGVGTGGDTAPTSSGSGSTGLVGRHGTNRGIQRGIARGIG